MQLVSDDDEETECTQPPSLDVIDVSNAHATIVDDSYAAETSACAAASDQSTAEMEEWLSNNVIVQYWKGECESRLNSFCRSSNIAVDWFVFEIRDNNRMLQLDKMF